MQEIVDEVRKVLAPTHAIENIEGVPHLVHRADVQFKPLPELLERLMPTRIKRGIVAHDVRGFVDYVNTYKHPQPIADAPHGPQSRIYVGPFEAAKLEARLDDVQPHVPSYVSHLVTYGCPLTREWKTWIGSDGTKRNQIDFAEFLEANLVDIVEPAAADLLAATLDFSNAQKAEFASAVRLHDGTTQFKWSQDNTGMQARFPEKIKLGLRVYEGLETAYTVTARLKFRLNNAALSIWYELERPDIVQRAAYEKLLAQVGEQTGCPVIRAL